MYVECKIDNYSDGNIDCSKVIVSNVFADKDTVSIVIGNEVAVVDGEELVSAIRKCTEDVNRI